MATLLETERGRCDARCHTAKVGTPCDCPCGGRYHGVGARRAVELLEQDIQAGRYGEAERQLLAQAREAGRQLELFDSGRRGER